MKVLTIRFVMHSPLVDGKTCCLLGGLWSIDRICNMRPIGGKAPTLAGVTETLSAKAL